MAYPRSTDRNLIAFPSWDTLAYLRKRGQVPTGGIWVCDSATMRSGVCRAKHFGVPPPEEGQGYLVAGLEVLMYATRTDANIAAAQVLASGNPKRFTTCWRRDTGEFDWEDVI